MRLGKIAWVPSPKFCASSAHTGWGTAFLLAGQTHDWSPWIGFTVLTAWGLFKEYLLDLFVIEHDSVAGSTLDFVTYEVAVGIALLNGVSFVGALLLAAGLLTLLAYLDYKRYFPFSLMRA